MKKSLLILMPTLVMALASCGSAGGSTTTSTSTSTTSVAPTKSAIQIAYEEASSLGSQEVSTDEFTFSGVITGFTGNAFYIQEGEYGFYIFDSKYEFPEDAQEGKIIEITAKVTNYYGCIETSTVSNAVIKGDGTLPDPVVIESKSDLTALNQNILVNVNGKLPSTLDPWDANHHSMPKMRVGDDDITVKFDKYGYDETRGEKFEIAAGHDVKLTNLYSTCYDSSGSTQANQFIFAGTSDIEVVPVPATEVTLSASLTEVTAGQNVTLTTKVAPTNSTDKATIKIVSGSEYGHLVDNELVTEAAGTIVLQASAGSVKSSEVTIIVTEEEDPTVGISFSSFVGEAYVGDILTKEMFVVEANKQSGASVVIDPEYDIEFPYSVTKDDIGKLKITASYLKFECEATLDIHDSNKVLSLDCTSKLEGGNGQYAKDKESTIDGITWDINANTNVTKGWRFGGKDITNVDRFMFNTTAITLEANKFELTIGDITGITLNTTKIYVYSSLDDVKNKTNPIDEFEIEIVANSVNYVYRKATSWKDCFYRFEFNVTNKSTSDNGYVQLRGLALYNNIAE